MLEALRKAAGTWVAKLLLGLLVVSFAVWGISGSIFGGPGNNVISAGDTRVSVLEYRLAYDRQLMVMSQQFGTRLTREQAAALGIDQQVLAQLIAGAVLDEQASEMRLGLSRDRLAALTAQDPAFQGPDGRFDRNQFEYVLRQVGMRPEDYLRNREQVAIRQQVVEAVSDGLSVPDTYLRAVSLYRGEDRTVDFVVVPRGIVEPIAEPSEEQLASFFDGARRDYAAPEYRTVSYVKLEPADIADESAIQDDQVRAYYDKNIARFTTPESRRIEQLVFASAEAAQAALDKIRAGISFEDVVAAEGKTMADVLLGTFRKDAVADPAIAEAAFALEQGGVSDVVAGTFGSVLVRVTEITPAVVRPYEEVAAGIRHDLAVDEATRILLDVHDGYEDARAGGASMAEAAERQKLRMVTIEAIDRGGQDMAGNVVADIPESAALLREAFETEAGIENPPITLGASGFLFFEVDRITPARDRALDEVRDRVVADWKAQEASSLMGARMSALKKRLDDGAAFADIAGELGMELQTKRGLKRDADDADFGRAGSAAVFGVAQGATGIVASPQDGAQVLFKVTEVIAPFDSSPDSVPPEQQTAFSSGMADDLLDQLVALLQTRYPVSVNQAAINQALSF
jgi:peptidyl-prolyl cis-trans isomerase D